jgi:hypothetical protein
MRTIVIERIVNLSLGTGNDWDNEYAYLTLQGKTDFELVSELEKLVAYLCY